MTSTYTVDQVLELLKQKVSEGAWGSLRLRLVKGVVVDLNFSQTSKPPAACEEAVANGIS